MALGRGRNGSFPDGRLDGPLPGLTAPLSMTKIALPLAFSPHSFRFDFPMSGQVRYFRPGGPIPDDKCALTCPSAPIRRLLPLSSQSGH